ncbi:MAG: FAD binding domain-containing protein [Anaerolineales bacterium]
MIEEYYRPKTLTEALEILQKKGSAAKILAGGTSLRKWGESIKTVVDLQSIGFDQIAYRQTDTVIGAMVTLDQFAHLNTIPSALRQAIELQASFNQRQIATVAGSLLTANGRSTFATAMLALNARLHSFPSQKEFSYGDVLALSSNTLAGEIVTEILIPTQVQLAFEYVARTPADLPLVCVALARWNSGRLRLALGGWGKTPMLVLDGVGKQEVALAARSAYSQAVDEWASASYRSEIAALLAQRCLNTLDGYLE